MKNNYKRILLFFSKVLVGIGKKIEQITLDKNYLKWVIDNGDKTFRLNYELDATSIVFDVGGFEGQWASDIYAKYNCKTYIFEPVISFYTKIQERFKGNANIITFPFGISSENKEIPITLNNDGSSFYKTGNQSQIAKIVRITDFVNEHNIKHISLIKINIEGGEYDLLDHIIKSGLIYSIDNLQIQFHNIFPNAKEKVLNLQLQLSKTHELTYSYPLIWENWRIKS